MKSKHIAEYKTTTGEFSWRRTDDDPRLTADDPVSPGEDWKMIGSAATDSGAIFWFWCREIIE